jgi:hypothetical protein
MPGKGERKGRKAHEPVHSDRLFNNKNCAKTTTDRPSGKSPQLGTMGTGADSLADAPDLRRLPEHVF